MAKQVLEYKCLLISPSDVGEERNAIERALAEWNAHIGAGLDARVQVVRWESHSLPEHTGEHPQTVLNRQIVDGCDMGVAVFWARLGSPTGEHKSGSLEEIDRLRKQGSPVLVYFSSKPVPQDRLRDDQFSRLSEARKAFEKEGIVERFETPERLAQRVTLHITRLVTAFALKATAPAQPIRESEKASKPDVRIQVRTAIETSTPRALVSVVIQNHSLTPVYVEDVFLIDSEGETIWLRWDTVTEEFVENRQIGPSDSFTVHFDPEDIPKPGEAPLKRIRVVDKIGRRFETKDGPLADAVKETLEWNRKNSPEWKGYGRDYDDLVASTGLRVY